MAIVLIATDNTENAKQLKTQLTPKYVNVFTSTDPYAAVVDFDSHRPDVLVLAFTSLEVAESYYLKLNRLSNVMLTYPHRTIILCDKEEINRGYELCKQGFFDDYILFWPVTDDTSQLDMTIHCALRDLTAFKAATVAQDLAIQARRVAVLESPFDSELTHVSDCIDEANHSLGHIEQEMKVFLDSFFQQLSQGSFAKFVEIKDANGLQREITRLQQEKIHGLFHACTESITPLKVWTQKFRQKCAAHFESIHSLRIRAEKITATILIVDDDKFARKLIKAALEKENYELIFASSSIEALILLSKRRPDLILMDMMLPDIDGMEATHRIKSTEQFSAIPIIMVTGNSEKSVVINCLKAGATDFVVKPFEREILLDKIRKLIW